MAFNITKFVNTRNAFSREYGTWIIVILNLIFTPIYLKVFNHEILYFILLSIFLLAFRFELLDLYSLKLSKSRKKRKLISLSIYLLLSIIFFFLFFIQTKNTLYLALLPIISFLIILNIMSRRKKGKKQHILIQMFLTGSVGFLPSIIYYFIGLKTDALFWQIGICSALYYMNSSIFVRAKTVGSPFDIYSLLFTILLFIIGVIMTENHIIEFEVLFLFLPSLIKEIDNLVLANFKVPLKRIGLNETFHALLYTILYILLF